MGQRTDSAGAPRGRRGAWLRRALREPLTHFLVFGALIFVGHRALRPDPAPPRAIVVDEAFVEGLRARHRERTGRDPTEEELEGLVTRHVREEALVREARAAGLDHGDPIVRRRLVQKMEFVLAASGATEPTDEALEAWVEAHGAELRLAPRVTLTHVFFSRERRGSEAEGDAAAALATLRAGADASTIGDPFPLGPRLSGRTREQLVGQLGEALAEAAFDQARGGWGEPVASAYGVHLLRVDERSAGRRPELSEVRERAVRALTEERRQARLAQRVDALVGRYEVRRP